MVIEWLIFVCKLSVKMCKKQHAKGAGWSDRAQKFWGLQMYTTSVIFGLSQEKKKLGEWEFQIEDMPRRRMLLCVNYL